MVCVHEIYYENFTFVFVSGISVAWAADSWCSAAIYELVPMRTDFDFGF